MSQSGLARVSTGSLPPTVPLQFTGDNGTIAVPAANNITIFADNVSGGAGSSVKFENSGSTSTLKLSDSRNNVFLGFASGPLVLGTASVNTAVGNGSQANITSGTANTSLGYITLGAMTTGSFNTALGDECLSNITTGQENIAIGNSSGTNCTGNDSSNILIGESGNAGESNVIRLGTQGGFIGAQNKCYIAGITGVVVPISQLVTINDSTQQMGIIVNGTTGQVLTATTGSSPTFQNVSSSGAVITLTGNSGGAISPTAGNINTLGTGSITIAGAGSTLTTQLTGITNHALQVGAGTATLTQLANGTSGQILTAVTGADPVWAAPASTFTPNSVINIVEDFIGTGPPGGNTSAYGQLNWFANVAWTVDATIGDSGHNGVIASAALAAGNQDIFLNGQSPVNAIAPQMILGGGAIQLNFVIKVATLSTGTNTYTLRVGFGVTANADQVNGVYFEYTNGVNSGNWQFKTANASTRTTSNSAIAVGTSYVNLGITINAAGTSCAFTANGVSLGTAIATNIPTVAITPFIDIVRSAGTVPAAAILFDLMYFTQTLTTPR